MERKLQVVQDVATALGSTLDLDRLLQVIMTKVTEVLEADRSTLYLLDEERGELWSKVTQGGEVQEIRLQVPEGIAGWVAQTGETLNIPDAYQDDRFHQDVDRQSGYRTRSMLTMPMMNNHGKAVGVVQVLNKKGDRAFEPEDEELLRALTAQAAVSIENGKLYQSLVKQKEELVATRAKLEQRMFELDLLYEMEQESLGARDLDDLLDRLTQKAMALVRARAASTVMLAPDRADLHFATATGPHSQKVCTLRVSRGQGIAGWVIDHDEPLNITDVSADPRHNREAAEAVGYHPRAILCVPIRGEVETLGALELLDKATEEGAAFDENDRKLAALIAGHMAKVIQLARARQVRIREGRLASIGQMLSGVLHDLKTPMTIASGYAQLLPGMESPQQRGEISQEILRQLQLMDAMTREVVAFARGDSQILVRKVYLHQFLSDLADHLSREFEGKGVSLQLETPYQGTAWFDELKIRRVLQNLSSNAVRAMPQGGVFTLRCEREPDALLLTVSDTGEGIPPEMEGRLFELFATSGRAGGTGLGLAIVKKIVSDHGGSIRYETERGKGTTFVVSLPFPQQDQEADVYAESLV